MIRPHTVSGVGTTGSIFAAIAVAWLAYLVPISSGAADDDEVDGEDPSDRFSDSIRIVRHGTAPLLDQDLAEIPAYEVSTPLTRRAAINDLRRLERLAAAPAARAADAADAQPRRSSRSAPSACAVVDASRSPAGCWSASSSWPGSASAACAATWTRASGDPPRQQRDHHLPQPRSCSGRRTTRPVPCAGRGGEAGEARRAVGSGADHHADVRLQAPGAAYGTDYRPVQS